MAGDYIFTLFEAFSNDNTIVQTESGGVNNYVLSEHSLVMSGKREHVAIHPILFGPFVANVDCIARKIHRVKK